MLSIQFLEVFNNFILYVRVHESRDGFAELHECPHESGTDVFHLRWCRDEDGVHRRVEFLVDVRLGSFPFEIGWVTTPLDDETDVVLGAEVYNETIHKADNYSSGGDEVLETLLYPTESDVEVLGFDLLRIDGHTDIEFVTEFQSRPDNLLVTDMEWVE